MNKSIVIFCGILFILKNNFALEYNRQRVNTNTDFLLHEAGAQGYQNGGKRDDYGSQFPALGSPVTPKTTSTTVTNNSGHQRSTQTSNGKRDYVAPQWPTVKPAQTTQSVTPKSTTANSGSQANSQSNGKRDYVAPQIPTVKPVHNNQPVTPKSTSTTVYNNLRPGQQSNGKRDYVAPQFPTLKPVQNNQPTPTQNNQPTGTKVKDLINFYDNKNPGQGTPSYSSILKNPTNKNEQSTSTRFTQQTSTVSPVQPTKPMSFSSIVAGQNKPSTTLTTAKPTTRVPSTPGSRPSTPVLPSSIVNNNPGANTNSANGITDAELQALSEELLRKDTNNAARYITVNYQEKTTSSSTEDRAPRPLLTVSPEVWNIPTIQKFVPLLDNYERDSLVNEHVTPQERIEENDFMDTIMATTVMRHLMTYLKNKGLVTQDPRQQRDFVKQLWFSLYSRGKGKIGSSGFEHVFVSELKNGGISGLHNWIYFAREEAANRVNYLGYLKYAQLNDKGAVLKYHFNQQGVDKPVNTMFIGTSPELEIALYTLCYVTRVENDCKLKLGNKDVDIITYNYRYRSKNLIGSAYPQI